MRRSIVTTVVALAAIGCGGEPADEAAPSPDAGRRAPEASAPIGEGALVIRLVDSIPWATELAEGTYRRVEVRLDGVVDTIPGVEVESPPVIVGDSAVHGFDWAAGTVERGFRWTRRGGVAGVALPAEFLSFTAFALAPDASHVAYVGRGEEAPDGRSRLAAVVRAWPDGAAVHESHAVTGYPSGERNSRVEWLSADSVDVRIRLDDLETPGGSWLRVAGSPSTGSFAADTVAGG